MRIFVLASCMLFSMYWTQTLASPPETGFNTHLRGTGLTPDDFTADVDDMVNHQQRWVRLNVFEDVASWDTSALQLVWNQDALTEYDNAISYAVSKGLKIYLVTNTPSFARNFATDVYLNVTFQYHQFLASRYQGKIA